jgi:hypothetical protein
MFSRVTSTPARTHMAMAQYGMVTHPPCRIKGEYCVWCSLQEKDECSKHDCMEAVHTQCHCGPCAVYPANSS